MSTQREFIVLAASRKHSSRCYAGKELYPMDRVGDWIRPVTAPDGRLNLRQIRLTDGTLPQCLDLIRLDLHQCCPLGHQNENWLLPWNSKPSKIMSLPLTAVPYLCDKPDSLWINGHSSSQGKNDRVLSHRAASIRQSLYLVELEHLRIRVEEGWSGKLACRAFFRYTGTEYALRVTDCDVEEDLLIEGQGEYHYRDCRTFGCISLSPPYRESCYKLLAAVYAIPRKG